jgi:serine/threonine protein phosphatase PrpC
MPSRGAAETVVAEMWPPYTNWDFTFPPEASPPTPSFPLVVKWTEGSTVREVEVDPPHIRVVVLVPPFKGTTRTIRLLLQTSDPTTPGFELRLENPPEEEAWRCFVPGSGWELENLTTLRSPVLGRPPTPLEKHVVVNREVYEKLFLTPGSIKRGPDGFLPWYTPRVLGAAAALAFDAPIGSPFKIPVPPKMFDDGARPLTKLNYFHEKLAQSWAPKPITVTVTKHVCSKWGPDYTEDVVVHEEDAERKLVMMAAIDGHGGNEVAQLVAKNAWPLFTAELDGGLWYSDDRDWAVRAALREMCSRLDDLCFAEAKEANERNRVSGLVDAVASCFVAPPPPNKKARKVKEPLTLPKPESSAGAVACFAVIDLQQGVAHVASVGDCFAFVRDQHEGTQVVSVEHSAHLAQEQARTMLCGGYVTPPTSGGWRVPRSFGVYMASRAFGECDIKNLRPEIARSLKAEPTLTRVEFLRDWHTHFAVATDGLYVGPHTTVTATAPRHDYTLAEWWTRELNSGNFDDASCAAAELHFTN